MNLDISRLTGALILAVATSLPTGAIAQPDPTTLISESDSIAEAFNRAYFYNDPEFFRNTSVKRQIDTIFGPGSIIRNSFPENEINRDGRLVHELYETVLEQQTSKGQVFRTPDLPNPYSTSILESPTSNVRSSEPESELIFESGGSQ